LQRERQHHAQRAARVRRASDERAWRARIASLWTRRHHHFYHHLPTAAALAALNAPLDVPSLATYKTRCMRSAATRGNSVAAGWR